MKKGRRREDSVAALHCLKGSNERRSRYTLLNEGTTENRHKQQDGKFQPDKKKKILQ